MVELSDKYISNLERKLYDPSLKTIDSLAKALNIETYLLLKYNPTFNLEYLFFTKIKK